MTKQSEFLVELREGQKNFDILLTNYIKEYLILFGTKDFKKLLNCILDDMNIKNMRLTKI